MSIDEVQIGMAQPAGLGIDQHFMRKRVGKGDFADGQALARLFKNRGFCH